MTYSTFLERKTQLDGMDGFTPTYASTVSYRFDSPVTRRTNGTSTRCNST